MTRDFLALQGRPGDLVGPALRLALVTAADEWLQRLLGDPGPGVALVAVGGYGRREPAPGTDLDLVLVHDGRQRDISALADALWYPIWNAGVGLDHSVRTVEDAVAVAAWDLKAALGLLDARHVAGDPRLSAALVEEVRKRWRARAPIRLPELHAAVVDRAATAGEVAFLLEPDLKEGRGGLRDVHALRALAAAQVHDPPSARVQAAYDVLLDVRGALPVRGRRRSDRLPLQEQDGVAAVLGYPDADALMHAVADAGRTIAHAWDIGWHQVAGALSSRTGRWRRGRSPLRRPLDEGVIDQNGEVVLALDAEPGADPVLPLRAAAAAARAGLPLAPYTVERLTLESPPLPRPWPGSAREALVALLGAGAPAVPVLEALDQAGVLVRLLPEWSRVRSKPQRNPYHRFTVDRHLVETAANAAALTRRVSRPDLLLLAGFLHDIGKGWPGDHVVAGADVVRRIGPALGLPEVDVDVLVTLVREHLTLAEAATRRDLDDPATAERVAAAVRTPAVLALLHALTEADSIATGPVAWSQWKAALVSDLVGRTADMLGGQPRPRPPELTSAQRAVLAALSPGDVRVDVPVSAGAHGVAGAVPVLIAAHDRPGLLATVAGVLALHRLDVRRAVARSVAGRALVDAAVIPAHGSAPDPGRLRADLLRALDGQLAVADRLAQRERSYSRSGSPAAAPPEVSFEDAADATVVEVRAADGVGVLHRIASCLVALDLDIRLALVATLGLDVVDVFYVRGADGTGLSAAARRRVCDVIRSALVDGQIPQQSRRDDLGQRGRAGEPPIRGDQRSLQLPGQLDVQRIDEA